MEKDIQESVDTNILDSILHYFSVDKDNLGTLTRRETGSLNAVGREIAEWKPSGDRRNIFLVDSYTDSRRNIAAAYIANRLLSEKFRIILIERKEDLRKKVRQALRSNDQGKPVVFLNHREEGIAAEKEFQKIILSLGKRTLREVPLILSVPNRYSEIFRGEEKESDNVSFPQNQVSRGYVMLGTAILLMPFLNFPYLQVPFGAGSAVNDAGAAVIALFLYGTALIFSSKKRSEGKQFRSALAAVIIFVLSYFVIGLIEGFMQPVFGYSLPAQPEIASLNVPASIFLCIPIFMRIASLTIFPLGIAGYSGRMKLYVSYAVASLSAFVSSLFFSFNYIAVPWTPYVAQFQNEYLQVSILSTGSGNVFIQSVASIPAAVVYFFTYISISGMLKEKYIVTPTRRSGDGSSA